MESHWHGRVPAGRAALGAETLWEPTMPPTLWEPTMPPTHPSDGSRVFVTLCSHWNLLRCVLWCRWQPSPHRRLAILRDPPVKQNAPAVLLETARGGMRPNMAFKEVLALLGEALLRPCGQFGKERAGLVGLGRAGEGLAGAERGSERGGCWTK